MRWWDGSAWSYDAAPSARPVRKSSTVLVGAAVGWGALLIYLAVVLPVYTVGSNHAGLQPRHSLVRVFGYRVLLLAAIPCIVSVLVALLLRVAFTTQRRRSTVAAAILAWTTLIAAVVGSVTIIIGIYVLPVGVLLCVATAGARSRH